SLTDYDISSEQQQQVTVNMLRELPVFAQKCLNLIGVVEWQQEKTSPRILYIKNILKLNLISRVSLEARVDIVIMCSRCVDNFINDLNP
ncbi:phosphate acetyltransferase, partial [Francisella tularensis subsp. holarctica]|nr:phosphate acetyltransferase [Francisella tularensis subsp. holarctica]